MIFLLALLVLVLAVILPGAAGCLFAGLYVVIVYVVMAIFYFTMIFFGLRLMLGEQNTDVAYSATLPIGVSIMCFIWLFTGIPKGEMFRHLRSRKRLAVIAIAFLALGVWILQFRRGPGL